MAHTSDSWVDRVISAASQNLLDVVERAIVVLGETAPGLPRGSRWEVLEQWIYMRRDPAVWTNLLMEWGRFIGPDAAALFAVREAHRLEGLLARAGGWDGEAETYPAAIERGVGVVGFREGVSAATEARRAAEGAQRLMNRPRVLVGPDVAPVDALQQVTGVVAPPIPPPVALPPPPGMLPVAPTGPAPMLAAA